MNNQSRFIDDLLALPPFEKNEEDKKDLFSKALHAAFTHHLENNELFRRFCNKRNFDLKGPLDNLAGYPYLPVNIFKNRQLSSVPAEKIKTVLNSSATTGTPSTIVIDALTSKRQTLASAKVMVDYLGNVRRPFLILDEDPSQARSMEISARSAATRGFLMLASSAQYFLHNVNGQLTLDVEGFERVLKEYEDKKQEVCIFGFTFILYHNFIRELMEKNIRFRLSADSKVVHIGGWKKLENQKVTKDVFLEDTHKTLGVEKNNIVDFYGFTEQMGLVYANTGNLPKTVSLYSEIIIRDFQTLGPVKDGEVGLIQILTPLPHSYPGISVLTEDVGRIVSRGKDINSRWGTQFEIIGRAQKAEARGCGDILSEVIEGARS